MFSFREDLMYQRIITMTDDMFHDLAACLNSMQDIVRIESKEDYLLLLGEYNGMCRPAFIALLERCAHRLQ